MKEIAKALRNAWNVRLVAALSTATALGGVACQKDEGGVTADPQGGRATQSSSARTRTHTGGGDIPPPAAPVASADPKYCADGGDQAPDTLSAPFFPRKAGAYCLRVSESTFKTYGANATLSMDQVCTTAFDGECEIYKGYGLKRLVTATYKDGANVVNVNLCTMATPAGAYAMLTKRLVTGDPAETTMKPLAAGGAAATGGGVAYVWKGEYFIELQFNANENLSRKDFPKAAAAAIEPIAIELGNKLPGTNDKLPAVKALPEANLLPLGVELVPKDAFGVKGLETTAIGFYKEGDKRYRLVAVPRGDAEQAKATMQALSAKASGKGGGAEAVSDVGDEAIAISLTTSPDSKERTQFIFARKGALVVGVSDESPEKKLTKDEKVAKLKAWLLSAAPSAVPPAPSPSGAASARKP